VGFGNFDSYDYLLRINGGSNTGVCCILVENILEYVWAHIGQGSPLTSGTARGH
jgi:hypothetical protein